MIEGECDGFIRLVRILGADGFIHLIAKYAHGGALDDGNVLAVPSGASVVKLEVDVVRDEAGGAEATDLSHALVTRVGGGASETVGVGRVLGEERPNAPFATARVGDHERVVGVGDG